MSTPARNAKIPIDRVFKPHEFERLARGSVPKEQEDHWFFYYEEPWLCFHRSWTGFCTYRMRFEGSSDGMRVEEVIANRDPDQYLETVVERDRELVVDLLDGIAGRYSILERVLGSPSDPKA